MRPINDLANELYAIDKEAHDKLMKIQIIKSKYTSLEHLLLNGFKWLDTKDGYHYWNYIVNKVYAN